MAEFPALPLWTDAYLADCDHLTDAEHGRYLMLLMHMWRAPNRRFPNDDAWLARKFRRPVEQVVSDLRPLLAEFFQTDGNWLFHKRLEREWIRLSEMSRKQSERAKSRWEKEKDGSRGNAKRGNATTTTTRTQKRTSPNGEDPKPDTPDLLQVAVSKWNEVCGDALPRVTKLTTDRRKLLRTVLTQDCAGSLDAWETYCRRIRASRFCCGDNGRSWRADIDFALKSGRYTRVLEGKYDNGSPTIAAYARQQPQHSTNRRRGDPMEALRANLALMDEDDDEHGEGRLETLSGMPVANALVV